MGLRPKGLSPKATGPDPAERSSAMPNKFRAHAVLLAVVATWLIGGAAPAAGQGIGLTGQYYNDPGTGAHFVTLVLTRTDPTVNFDWASGSPGTGVQIDNFSVRWTGQVLTPVTGSYTFQTISDDGVRLWVNGQLVIDNWTDHGPTANTSPAVSLVAGTKYDVKMEFYEHGSGAFARLSWAYPGQTTQVIPQAQLYPPGAASNQAPTANAGADQTITLPNAATLTGTVADDGKPNPPGALTSTWSKVSGPGTVTFSNPNALSTTATFSANGVYVVRLTVSDSALTGSDDATITANPAPTGSGVTGSGT